MIEGDVEHSLSDSQITHFSVFVETEQPTAERQQIRHNVGGISLLLLPLLLPRPLIVLVFSVVVVVVLEQVLQGVFVLLFFLS